MSDKEKEEISFKCLSMVICETVIDDVRTRNKSYINTFNHIVVETLPVVYPKLTIVCSLTDFSGEKRLSMSIKFDKNGEEIGGIDGRVFLPDPLHVIDLVFQVQNICFAKYGNYSVELSCNKNFICSRRFSIASKENLKKIKETEEII